MQAGQATLKQYNQGAGVNLHELTPSISNWLTRIFGCWHKEMSRPFTHDGESYRVCLDCGARRTFDASRWEMVGDFYYQTPCLTATSHH
jgi:hypothetical protein